MRQITFTAKQRADLIEVPDLSDPLKPYEVRGRTVISLTSPGSELNGGYLGENFPVCPGYACVFSVTETGAEVTDLPVGSLVFESGNHKEWQVTSRQGVIPVPAGLSAERAVFARLMGVSMSTLNTTTARPPSRVLVTGLGPVGNLAAQIFAACGYAVTAVDPVEYRRIAALQAGLKDVRASVAEGPVDITGKVALHLECSGHETAVLDGCKCVAKRGEVVLLGVPWQRRTNMYAFDILHAVFHRYLVLRTGWEWEVPLHPTEFRGNSSIMENYAAAMDWIASGKIKVDNIAALYSPSDAQRVYSGLLNQTLPKLSALFDWRLLPPVPQN
jgi:threonine dehydrogenase-like Zn-dependent dehydrogenase